VKLQYNGPGYKGHLVNRDIFFLAEFLLISTCNNMVKTESDTTDFPSLQTSFWNPMLMTMLDITNQ